MTKYAKMLEESDFKRSIENKLVNEINYLYLKIGKSPPLPKLHNNQFYYDDTAANKAMKRMRRGVEIALTVLDEKEKQ